MATHRNRWAEGAGTTVARKSRRTYFSLSVEKTATAITQNHFLQKRKLVRCEKLNCSYWFGRKRLSSDAIRKKSSAVIEDKQGIKGTIDYRTILWKLRRSLKTLKGNSENFQEEIFIKDGVKCRKFAEKTQSLVVSSSKAFRFVAQNKAGSLLHLEFLLLSP